MNDRKSALILVQSDVKSDPRVRRQIDWLSGAGWIVDTIGFGELPSPSVRAHFALLPLPKWVLTPFGTLIVYLLLPYSAKFKILSENRIPTEAGRRIRDLEYSLFVFNDTHLIPWVKNGKVFTERARGARFHLDLHEYFTPRLKRNSLWRIATGHYYAWVRRLISDPVFTTRSTVARGIADLYVEELQITRPTIVRNSPPYVDLVPQPVDEGSIKLIHHGMASWARGLKDIVDAMRELDDRFTMTFMLAGSPAVTSELARYAEGLGDRVKIVPPVPMRDLSAVVNAYDLEVLFYRPTTLNLEFALPNKLFEAVQGRLGLVVGRSPMMIDIVETYGNGVIVEGWAVKDLVATLTALTAEQVRLMKAASQSAAPDLSAEAEGRIFLATVTGVP